MVTPIRRSCRFSKCADLSYRLPVVIAQIMAKKCKNVCNKRAQELYCATHLTFTLEAFGDTEKS